MIKQFGKRYCSKKLLKKSINLMYIFFVERCYYY